MGRIFPPDRSDRSGRDPYRLDTDRRDNGAVPVGPATLDSELHPGWNRAQPEHIPAPTYWPAALALGVTLLLWGLITSPLLAGIGLLVFVTALAGWIGELRNEHRE